MNIYFQSSVFESLWDITRFEMSHHITDLCRQDTHDNVSLDSPQETGRPDHFSSTSANLKWEQIS